MEEYLKTYQACADYCSYTDTPEELESCINDIKSDYGEQLCAKTTEECAVLASPAFKRMMEFYLKFLKILYCARSHHNNAYDTKIILVLGEIPLSTFGITSIDQLECVSFPGNNTYRLQFPKNLKEYLTILRKIGRGGTVENDPYLADFKDFCEDFQPWSRMFSIFVNKHSLELGLITAEIPAIEKTRNYGAFISDCDASKIQVLLESSSFNKAIIRYIKTGAATTPVSRRTRSRARPKSTQQIRRSSRRRSSRRRSSQKTRRLRVTI